MQTLIQEDSGLEKKRSANLPPSSKNEGGKRKHYLMGGDFDDVSLDTSHFMSSLASNSKKRSLH